VPIKATVRFTGSKSIEMVDDAVQQKTFGASEMSLAVEQGDFTSAHKFINGMTTWLSCGCIGGLSTGTVRSLSYSRSPMFRMFRTSATSSAQFLGNFQGDRTRVNPGSAAEIEVPNEA
jgi:hypothetical protein